MTEEITIDFLHDKIKTLDFKVINLSDTLDRFELLLSRRMNMLETQSMNNSNASSNSSNDWQRIPYRNSNHSHHRGRFNSYNNNHSRNQGASRNYNHHSRSDDVIQIE